MDDERAHESQRLRIGLALAAAMVLVGAGLWYWQRRAPEEQVASSMAAPVAADAAVSAELVPPIRHPLPQPQAPAADAAAASEAGDPDAVTAEALRSLSAGVELADWLIPDKLLRRIVATTDNLSRNARTEQLRPLRAPAGPLAVQREVVDATVGAERITVAAQNAARYDVPVSLLAKTDMQQAAVLYRRLYPQLQRAYEDLGYPDRYFNDRMVDTIDHLLETPEPAGPLLLEQPKVLYRFADPDLEARSSGQKLLLRMGVAHARVVKQKLREFRGQISSKE